jgi:hypothetical protein
VDVRRAHEEELLRLYQQVLAEGGVNYPYDDLFLDYRMSVLFCLVYNVIGSGQLDFANERGMALWRSWLERNATAVRDLDAGAIMP